MPAENSLETLEGLGNEVALFLQLVDLSSSTKDAYRKSLRRLAAVLGPGFDISEAAPEELRAGFDAAFGEASAQSWNRHLSAVRSLLGFLAASGVVDGRFDAVAVRRRARGGSKPAGARVLGRDGILALCRDRRHALRERTLWMVAYSSAARASEVLQMDVERIDAGARRCAVVGKGGRSETILWGPEASRLLQRLVRGRRAGPVFVTSARGEAAPGDTCPSTGRVRLSYRRAAELFKAASGGATLHQLRHSRLTHLAEDGTDVTMLRALSRHNSLRSLEVYVEPSDDSVAEMLAESRI